jgi:hypothetical protein
MDAHLEMGEANITYERREASRGRKRAVGGRDLDIMERTKAKDRPGSPAGICRPGRRVILPNLS